jgi:hypothetical protein
LYPPPYLDTMNLGTLPGHRAYVEHVGKPVQLTLICPIYYYESEQEK